MARTQLPYIESRGLIATRSEGDIRHNTGGSRSRSWLWDWCLRSRLPGPEVNVIILPPLGPGLGTEALMAMALNPDAASPVSELPVVPVWAPLVEEYSKELSMAPAD